MKHSHLSKAWQLTSLTNSLLIEKEVVAEGLAEGDKTGPIPWKTLVENDKKARESFRCVHRLG